MDATIENPLGFDPMSDDPAATMGTGRCRHLNGTLEAVEHMAFPRTNDHEGLVVFVPAQLASCHDELLLSPARRDGDVDLILQFAGDRSMNLS
jgi:hypothetical protein